MIHPLVARLLGPRVPLQLVAGVAVYGLATRAAGGVVPAPERPFVVGELVHEQMIPRGRVRELTVVRDRAEQARFEAELARDAAGEE